jgi:hypothetical protein
LVGGGCSKFKIFFLLSAAFISYRRRRLVNFENFRYLGGDGYVFFEQIGGDGGSADRLTPLIIVHFGI